MEVILFICADPSLALANNVYCPPPMADMALSLTSYWLFDDLGQPVAWGGQADGDPFVYANMYPTSPDHAWNVAACIGSWTRRYHTTAVSFFWGGAWRELACYDAFGAVNYREPFYHDGYGRWVIPVDILSPEPIHGLVMEWETAVVAVGAVD